MLALAEMEASIARNYAAGNGPADNATVLRLRASRKELATQLQAEQRAFALRNQIARVCLGFTALVALGLLGLTADQLRREVAQRRRSEQETAAQRDIAEEATRAKSDFLANMRPRPVASHSKETLVTAATRARFSTVGCEPPGCSHCATALRCTPTSVASCCCESVACRRAWRMRLDAIFIQAD